MPRRTSTSPATATATTAKPEPHRPFTWPSLELTTVRKNPTSPSKLPIHIPQPANPSPALDFRSSSDVALKHLPTYSLFRWGAGFNALTGQNTLLRLSIATWFLDHGDDNLRIAHFSRALRFTTTSIPIYSKQIAVDPNKDCCAAQSTTGPLKPPPPHLVPSRCWRGGVAAARV